MRIEELHSVYFIGIGGIGMSALAQYFHARGIAVYGYDRVRNANVERIEALGIPVVYSDSADSIQCDFLDVELSRALVIYTPAVPSTNEILGFFKLRGYLIQKRSEALEKVTEGTKTIAVAGTHGKTTTSAMIAHLLNFCEVNCNAFLGGVATNFESNFLLKDDADYTVVEADEFDRSFLRLKPHIGIVTSVDADHLDIYEGEDAVHDAFRQFADRINPEGLALIRCGIEFNLKGRQQVYGLDRKDLDITATNIRAVDGNYAFQVWENGVSLGEIETSFPGHHNVENALAAIGVARFLEIGWDKIKAGIAQFKGVKRRFETHIKRENRVYIDDYAHHPREIDACVGSVKELYPDKRITGVFQPHLYSRTRDFADDFATSLEALNELLLMEIYPAREEPIDGVDSSMLFNKIRMVNKKLCEREDVIDEVLRLNPEVLLTMGAGDIDKMVAPLKDAINKKDE
ncbi:MAG: UDP-N-acetylmuramate--L-alanine ligase [Flavobacteriales bacterium]|nr:UDP-N-acetylmuramate--L-alanine ligase [Flavobacteriales bacterium]